MASRLKITWSRMAAVTSRNIEEEYFTATAGPTSHSPPPIEVAAITAPGPITRSRLRKPKGGGAGSSSTSQGGSWPWGAWFTSIAFTMTGAERSTDYAEVGFNR